MDELILACPAAEWLVNVTKPVQLIAALDDPVPDLPLLSRLREMNDLSSRSRSGPRAKTTYS